MKAIAREGNCLFSCLVVWSSGCFVVGAYDISFSKKTIIFVCWFDGCGLWVFRDGRPRCRGTAPQPITYNPKPKT